MTRNEHMVGIFTTDANLNILSWDDWLAGVTGILPDAARGQSLKALFPDLEPRGMLARIERVLAEGVVEVLSPLFHHYLIACDPITPSKRFDKMQQRVTIAPLKEESRIVGAIVTVEDVTARLERERELSEQMASPDEAARLRAAEELAGEDSLHSNRPLVEALGDQSWRVRKVAVDAIARQGGSGTVRGLLRAIRYDHRNPSILNSALQVLALSGVDVLEPLAECLGDAEADVRIYAANALGDQHDPRAIPALIKALDDQDPNVRYHTIESLGKLRAAEAVDALVRIAESGDFYLAFPSLDALTKIGDARVAPRLVPLLEDELLRAPAADALGQVGDEDAIAPLVDLLNRPGAPALVIAKALADLYDRYTKLYHESEHVPDLVRRSIAPTGAQNLLDALDETGDGALRPLALVLGWMEGEAIARALTRLMGRATARKEVIAALVRYGSKVTELLIEQLDSEDLEARQSAVLALGRIGDPSAVPALVKTLNADGELIIPAAGALAKIGDRRAFEALLGLIGHKDAAVRQAAVAAINSLGHPDMPARACVLLGDADPRVRESAVKIAGYFGYRECAESLIGLCEDPDENVRRAAIEHIPYLEDVRVAAIVAGAIKSGSPRVRASAAQALAQVDAAQAVAHLLEAMGDEDAWVRYFAARSVGKHGYTEALDALARLAQGDPASHVRIAAMDALGRIGGSRAVATLARLAELEDRELSSTALAGLGRIGHPDSLPPLVAALRSPDPMRRADALRALGERGGPGAVDAIQWVAAADAEPAVIRAAIDALAELATPEAIAALTALTADAARREASVTALSQLGRKHIELVGEGLSHAQASVRQAVVEALGRMKHPRASEILGGALDDEDSSVRLSAVNALMHLGSRSAERKLVAMARADADVAVRRAAQRALKL
jgi:HEAT repeat protein